MTCSSLCIVQAADLQHLGGYERARHFLKLQRVYQRMYGCGKPPSDEVLQKDGMCFLPWAWHMLTDFEVWVDPMGIDCLGIDQKRLKNLHR